MEPLVADSGPLIALARLDLLWLPSRLRRDVLVTEPVWNEVTRAPRAGDLSVLRAALDAGWLEVLPGAPEVEGELAGSQLGHGELAALSLARQRGAAVLMDELRGRAAAVRMGLRVVGTLGLLLAGREQRHLGALRPMLETLQHGGYFLSDRLVQQVLASAGE